MNLNILHITTEYRGDHDAEVKKAIQYVADETIESLILRMKMVSPCDVLEIRLVVNPK